jgi:excisionase family DNA binding protein
MLKNIDTNRDHLTTPEAAEHSGLTRTYLALLLRRGTLEGFRHGRDWFVYTDSLEAFLAAPRKSGPRGPRKPPSETHTNDADHQSQGNDLLPDFS